MLHNTHQRSPTSQTKQPKIDTGNQEDKHILYWLFHPFLLYCSSSTVQRILEVLFFPIYACIYQGCRGGPRTTPTPKSQFCHPSALPDLEPKIRAAGQGGGATVSCQIMGWQPGAAQAMRDACHHNHSELPSGRSMWWWTKEESESERTFSLPSSPSRKIGN